MLSGDFRSGSLRIATDPLDPDKVVEIAKKDVATHEVATVSPMPGGLLNTLNEQEILDLLAYLESSGQEKTVNRAP